MSKWKVTWTKNLIIGVAVSALLIVIDFASKWIVQSLVPLGQPIEVIPNFFYITKSYNIAVAFSIGSSWGVGGRVLNIAISLIMSVAIYFYWLTHDQKLRKIERVVAVLLAAGAVGNLIDRAFYWEGTTGFNGVIDFLQFYLGGGPGANKGFFNPFATFNFADSCLTIGIVLLLVILVMDMVKGNDRSLETDPRLKQKPAEIATKDESLEDSDEKEASLTEEKQETREE